MLVSQTELDGESKGMLAADKSLPEIEMSRRIGRLEKGCRGKSKKKTRKGEAPIYIQSSECILSVRRCHNPPAVIECVRDEVGVFTKPRIPSSPAVRVRRALYGAPRGRSLRGAIVSGPSGERELRRSESENRQRAGVTGGKEVLRLVWEWFASFTGFPGEDVFKG
jgi:hypothetical protein